MGLSRSLYISNLLDFRITCPWDFANHREEHRSKISHITKDDEKYEHTFACIIPDAFAKVVKETNHTGNIELTWYSQSVTGRICLYGLLRLLLLRTKWEGVSRLKRSTWYEWTRGEFWTGQTIWRVVGFLLFFIYVSFLHFFYF